MLEVGLRGLRFWIIELLISMEIMSVNMLVNKLNLINGNRIFGLFLIYF